MKEEIQPDGTTPETHFTVSLDLVSVKDIAMKGVRRAAIFMGLGLNVATDPNFKDYKLWKVEELGTSYELIPDLTHEQIADSKTHFYQWIVAGGIRELVESFYLYLDGIFRVCQLVDGMGKTDPNKPNVIKYGPEHFKEDRDFHKLVGTKAKFEKLRARFGISSPQEDYLFTISKVRNCLVHRHGLVAREDCNDGDNLTIKYVSPRFYIQRAGETDLIPIQSGGVIDLPHGGNMIARFDEISKSFRVGEMVEFTKHDLWDICIFILNCTDTVMQATEKFLISKGIEITKAETNEQDVTAHLATLEKAKS